MQTPRLHLAVLLLEIGACLMLYTLTDWLDDLPRWVILAMMVTCFATPPLLYLPEIRQSRLGQVLAGARSITVNAERLSVLALSVAVGAVMTTISLWLMVHQPPHTVWSHDTLSPEERVRQAAECRMRSLEVAGLGARWSAARVDYFNTCMVSHGFTTRRMGREKEVGFPLE